MSVSNAELTAKKLIQHGADVYVKNNRDELPLDKAKTAELRHYIESETVYHHHRRFHTDIISPCVSGTE